MIKPITITLPTGVQPVHYLSLSGDAALDVDGAVVDEVQACISVNGVELANFMCSPNALDQLAIGFLYNEGIIDGVDEIASLHLSNSNCVDVWLTHEFTPPERLIVTAGCGGGVTFDDFSQRHAPLTSQLTVTPAALAALMRDMHLGAALYQLARGIHTAALADETRLLMQVEDIGRHNCLDKLRGAALTAKQTTADLILLTSGRISSEMINKARRLETPVVCSRTSPTSLSVALAEAWHITIVAYLRQDRMRIYTHPERVVSGAA
jgi:FdhD protein